MDQYTGEIKGKYERPAFFVTMFRLHRWLLDSMKADGGVFWGKMIVGVSTLLFVVVLISGIVIWWPRTRKALKNSLRISVGRGFLFLPNLSKYDKIKTNANITLLYEYNTGSKPFF